MNSLDQVFLTQSAGMYVGPSDYLAAFLVAAVSAAVAAQVADVLIYDSACDPQRQTDIQL